MVEAEKLGLTSFNQNWDFMGVTGKHDVVHLQNKGFTAVELWRLINLMLHLFLEAEGAPWPGPVDVWLGGVGEDHL